jgi:2-hydroxy-3-keto-5-methylthiopentenyl-1-phosphate phosphatase
MQDTGHILFDAHGCGSERRKALDEQIKSGERSFRDVSEEMWGSLNIPFEDGFEAMEKELEIDPDFEHFHQFCINNNIPFNVISAGLKPILRKVLDSFLGEDQAKHIDIVANERFRSPRRTPSGRSLRTQRPAARGVLYRKQDPVYRIRHLCGH